MILLLALASATTLATPPVLDESTATLLRQRLERARAVISRDAHGKAVCAARPTTDEDRLDEMLCDEALRCVARGAKGVGAVNACVAPRRPEMLLAMRRLREYSR